MNKMKKKLMASIAMLVISTILMTSTSYAWYTINTKATAGDINVTLAQTMNVEIAKAAMDDDDNFLVPQEVSVNDSTGNYTFGASVEFKLTSSGTKLSLPAVVGSTTAATLEAQNGNAYDDGDADDAKYPQTFVAGDVLGAVYDTTGRTDGLVKAEKDQDQTSGIVTYSYDYLPGNSAEDKANIAFSYNMFVRTNIDGNIVVGYEKTAGADSKASIEVQYAKIGILGDTADATKGIVKSGDAITTLSLGSATDATGDADKYPNAQVKFEAKANTVYLLQIFCYFDGDSVIAADLTAGNLDATLKNLTFYNSAFYDTTKSAYKTAQGWETGDSSEPAATTALGWFDTSDITKSISEATTDGIVIPYDEETPDNSNLTVKLVKGTTETTPATTNLTWGSDSLTIAAAAFDGAGEYNIVITNSETSKSDTIKLSLTDSE